MDELSNDSRPRTPITTQFQEDLCSEKKRKVANALSADLRQPEDMGMREMDQYVHKLNKQNFDLKLEIFHRAQQMDTLKKKLERMHELEEQLQQMRRMEEELEKLRGVEGDNQRLRESNEQLRQELGTQDKAIGEAVDLICDLEARIEELEADRDRATEPTEQYLTASPETSETAATSPGPSLSLNTPKNKVLFDVPDRTSSRRGTRSTASHSRSATPAARPRRQPSFLRHENESTTALRSVYSSRALSVISQADTVLSGDEERHCPDSPNLSILSECSEFSPNMSPTLPANRNLSGLKPRPQTFELQPAEKETLNGRADRCETVSRVERWMQPQEKHIETRTPVKHTGGRKKKDQQPSLAPPFRAERHAQSRLRPPTQDLPMFGSGRFPPTPDTMSTSHANNRNGSNPSIIAEKSQYDSLYTPLTMNRNPRRRRSADELTTRPSTGSTVESGMNGYMVDDNYPLTSMFPTFTQITPISSRGRDQKDTAYTTDQSEPDSNKPQVSNSPPLAPADWLEAALYTPAPSHKRTDSIDHSKELPPPPIENVTPHKRLSTEPREGSPDTEVLELPPPASLRVRVADELHSGAKRVLNFKLFGRAVTVSHGPVQTPDAASSPSAARHSTSRRHSAHVKLPVVDDDPSPDEEASFDNAIYPTAITALPKAGDDEPNNRPTTAQSLENSSKRRSGPGLFGWMRASVSKETAHDTSSAHISPAALVATHALSPPAQNNKKKTRAQQQPVAQQNFAPRPTSELGHVRATSGGASCPDDGRKPKFHPRRFRKGKEKEREIATTEYHQ